MKREKRLTKREKKEQNGGGRGGHDHAGHIHCVACGRHIDPEEFMAAPPSATIITCQHKSQFAACVGCEVSAKYLVDEHDRTNKPVNAAPAYH